LKLLKRPDDFGVHFLKDPQAIFNSRQPLLPLRGVTHMRCCLMKMIGKKSV
jgi:hypothetical protein